MTSVAIDFGSSRTKVATFDNAVQRAVMVELGREIRSAIPSVAYVPCEGIVLFGDDAQLEGILDPQGLVRDLKWEIHKVGDIVRNGRRKSRSELVAEFFRHIRDDCQYLLCPETPISSCTLTVPLAFDKLQRNLLRAAANDAGFENVAEIDEPIAVARVWLRETPTASQTVAVCDIGSNNTSIALLRREGDHIRFHPQVPPHKLNRGADAIDHAIWDLVERQSGLDLSAVVPPGLAHQLRQLKESFTRLNRADGHLLLQGQSLVVNREIVQQCYDTFIFQFVEELSAIRNQMARFEIKDTPLLLAGGGAHLPGLIQAIQNDGWPGPVLQAPHSEFAVVLGAVESPTARGLGSLRIGRAPATDATVPAHINITTLGTSNSGRTSYLIAMYRMMRAGYRGFTITCQSCEDDVSLSAAWDRLASEGMFPLPSCGARTFEFDVNYGVKKIMGFSWYDFPGTTVTAPASGLGVADLRKRIHESDMLVVCFPFDELLEYATGQHTTEVRDVRRYARRLNQFLHDYYQENHATLPVALALTKADLCESMDDRAKVIDAIRKLIPGLFSRAPDDDDSDEKRTATINTPPPPDGWLVTLCWVTLGKGIGRLAPHEVADPAAIDPRCVHTPVAFAIYTKLNRMLDACTGTATQAAAQLTNAERESRHLLESIERIKRDLLAPAYSVATFRDGVAIDW